MTCRQVKHVVKRNRGQVCVIVISAVVCLYIVLSLWMELHAPRHKAFCEVFDCSSSAQLQYEQTAKRFTRPTAAQVEEIDPHPQHQFASVSDLPVPTVPPHIDCAAIFRGDSAAILVANQTNYAVDNRVGRGFVEAAGNSCSDFVARRGYLLHPVSAEEEEFPIAFSILAHMNVEQFERLLRAIYRPQNVYCLHVDFKEPSMYKFAKSISGCLGNVIVPENRVVVKWGEISVLEAEIICLRALLASGRPFKYFINLTGQEFPLKTNLELVRILKIFNGSNDITGEPLLGSKFEYRTLQPNWAFKNIRKTPPPHNITLMKGQVHIVASRDYIDYVINSQVAVDFLNWLVDTYIPDETFFTSLNYNYHLGIPGVFKGGAEKLASVCRFKMWKEENKDYVCKGMYLHDICIIGVGDLPALINSKQLFVNKFYFHYQPLAYDCLEQLHYNRTREDILNPSIHRFDLDFYRNLNFVKSSAVRFQFSPTPHIALLIVAIANLLISYFHLLSGV